ncbi:unannotated protein [freshwater metagenome]|uniref:Unannotated protein n=1 Tax=freshwater metagenome TaxID=449393 RepID=A0A6J7QVQ5_9ZZZZ
MTVAVTAFETGSIFDTVFEPLLVTQMLVPSKATPLGLEPTVTAAVTVFETGSIFDTVPDT